jgi:hypothetical protein
MRSQNSTLKGIFSLIIIFLFAAACSKDKFTTKPQLEFKRVNTHNVPYGGVFTFTLGFTDKEGDISDSLWIEEITTNCPASNLVARYKVPNFPAKTDEQGEFSISFVNTVILDGYATWPSPQCQRPDTATFRFWVRDKAGNVSDTVSVDKPMVIQFQ